MKHKILTGILVLAIIGAIGSDGGDNANSSMDNQSKEVAQNTEVESREDIATEEETKKVYQQNINLHLNKQKLIVM